MQRTRLFCSIVTALTLITGSAVSAAEQTLAPSRAGASTAQTTTVKGKIIKLNVSTGFIAIKDDQGKVWEFTVSPNSGIDLSHYKVGDTVTATINGTSATGDATLRARISKTELMRLQ